MARIDEPLRSYPALRDAFEKKIQALYDDYVKQSKVDLPSNESNYQKYLKQKDATDSSNRAYRSAKNQRTAMIVFAVIFLIAGIVSIAVSVMAEGSNLTAIILAAVFPSLALILAIAAFAYRKRIRQRLLEFSSKNKVLEKMRGELEEQMQPLWSIVARRLSLPAVLDVLKQTLPELDMRVGIGERENLLVSQESYDPQTSRHMSVCEGFSGAWSENPFIWRTDAKTELRPKVYLGTLAISWTETVPDGKGGTRIVHHTQVLTASKSAPAPVYWKDSGLFLLNNTLSEVNFSRTPSGIGPKTSDKEFSSYVKKRGKELRKIMDDSIKKGGTFTALANEDFEAVFWATDRTNEAGFRSLFTPLAQQNLIQLARSEPYGDDFAMVKEGKVIGVFTKHDVDEGIDFSFPDLSILSAKALEEDLSGRAMSFFRRLYFDWAPLLSIPACQMDGSYRSFSEKELDDIPYVELERVVNQMPQTAFNNPKATTEAILKIASKARLQGVNALTVRALSYQGVPRVDIVPTLGGDGRIHPVPVPWTEYLPLTNDTDWYVVDLYEQRNADVGAFLERPEVDAFLAKYPVSNSTLLKQGMLIWSCREMDEDKLSSLVRDYQELKKAMSVVNQA